MSGVDVLAYLRREVEKGKFARPHIVARRQAVHDAVAELIEAVEAYREADNEYGACGYDSEGDRLLREKLDAAERVDAALAAVTPADGEGE